MPNEPLPETSASSDPRLHSGAFAEYELRGFYDEMFSAPGVPRPSNDRLYERLRKMSGTEFAARRELADLTLMNQGITFAVYGSEMGTEKPFPVDLVPRIIPADEWKHLERGLTQRVQALNHFLNDVYGEGKIFANDRIPRSLVVGSPNFRHAFIGTRPSHGIHIHICGTDLIRDAQGTYRVLEDNCRTPSGVSYMIENRLILMRVFPGLFRENRVRPVDEYPRALLRNLRQLAPNGREEPVVVLLTPGVYNSAYFEHAFLAREMGIELVEGRDLLVEDACVFMKTTQGPQRVDVVYRRVDDDYLDPLTFRPESALGVPGLLNAYRAGNVVIANGIGTGVADDKAIYPYVPDMIRFYLDEEPILEQVPTYSGAREDDLKYMLENLDSLVVKATNSSGGYGMLMGPFSTAEERQEFKARIEEDPRGYIAQPLVDLSQSPCLVGEGEDVKFEGRHVDLRPYILNGVDGITVVPGALTRVALTKGSFVVNSSQGGGSKDTWVLADDGAQVQSMGEMIQTVAPEGMVQTFGEFRSSMGGTL